MISIVENLIDEAQESKSDFAPVRTLSAGRPAGPVIRGGREATERSVEISQLPPLAVTARNGHPLLHRVQVLNRCMPATRSTAPLQPCNENGARDRISLSDLDRRESD